MNDYLWVMIYAVIGVFYLGGFIYFFPSDKKLVTDAGISKTSLLVDVLYGVFFVLCLCLAFYVYATIDQQILQYSR